MKYGRISATLLGVAGFVIVVWSFILRPEGWGNPLSTLGALLIMFTIPTSFITGVLGIIYDKQRWPAIITTAITGTLLFLLFYNVVIK